MPRPPAVSDTSIADFEAIEAAVMETERGRWFLAEYARRNRHSDTEVLLSALSRIERGVSEQKAFTGIERFRTDLMDMANAIAEMHSQMAALPGPLAEQGGIVQATSELDAIIRTTEKATTDILTATEAIQDAAWNLREKGIETGLCDAIDEQATNIYQACSFQDLTAQRSSKVVDLLRFLDGRITAMIEIWGLQPAEDGRAAIAGRSRIMDEDEDHLSQSDIDFVLVETQPDAPQAGETETASAPVPDPAAPKAASPRALSDIDMLSDEEKAGLFV